MTRVLSPVALLLALAAGSSGAATRTPPAPAAHAGEALPASPSGLYRGTIAGEAVTVCFGGAVGTRSTAENGYYAEALGKTVELTSLAPARPCDWMESEPSSFSDAESFSADSDPWWTVTASTAAELLATRHVPGANRRPGDLAGVGDGDGGDDDDGGADAGGDAGDEAGGGSGDAGGAWKAAQPVALERLAADCAGFETARLLRPRLPHGTAAAAGITVELGEHPVTHVVAPTAVRGLPAVAAQHVADRLAEAARELDGDWADCRDFEGGVEVRFLDPRLLVFSVWSAGYCGGAHPDEERHPLAFDGRSGDPVALRDWFDAAVWSGGELVGGLRAALRQAMVAAEEDDVCAAHRDEVGWSGIDPWLEADGVHFGVGETDRAFLQCENDYVLPFALVRPFVAPSHRADFDALAHAAAARALVTTP